MTIIIRHRKLNVPPLCNFRPETVFTRLRPRGIVETIQDINGILDSCKTQRRPEFQDRSHGMTRLGLRVEGSYPLLTKTPMASSEIPESCTGPCNPWQPPGGSLKTHLRQQMLRDRESDRMLRGGGQHPCVGRYGADGVQAKQLHGADVGRNAHWPIQPHEVLSVLHTKRLLPGALF